MANHDEMLGNLNFYIVNQFNKWRLIVDPWILMGKCGLNLSKIIKLDPKRKTDSWIGKISSSILICLHSIIYF